MYILQKGSPTPDDIYDLRWRVGGLHKEDAAKVCDVSLRTWSAWESGFRRMPVATWSWFQVVITGLVPSKAWEGWSMKNGQLHSPDGATFNPGELLAIPYLRAQIEEMERTRSTPVATLGSNVELHPHLYDRLLTMGLMSTIGDLLMNLHRQFHMHADAVQSKEAPSVLQLAMSLNTCQDRISRSVWGDRTTTAEGGAA